MNRWIRLLALGLALGLALTTARAWDYELHRLVNELALQSLPAEFPDFVREPAARERVAFLAGEPDRWRNTADLPLRHANGPDHFFDVEDLGPLGLEPAALSPLRGEFLAQLVTARAARPDRFGPLAAAEDPDGTRWIPGLLPWRIAEDYARLKSAFGYLRTFETHGGTAAEIANARANVLYVMGVLGHFVGDAAQPLHTTRHFNGWAGDNPQGFTTNRTFHAWIDGGFLRRTGVRRAALAAQVRPARLAWPCAPDRPRDHVFAVALDYVLAQHPQVRPLYELERAGGLRGGGDAGGPAQELLERQLLVGAQMLGDLWYAAWRQAPPDTYLQAQLARRVLDGP
jgi:hypothetical protein